MTTPTGLNLVWAATGGTTDPTDTKYQTGWVAEIPTFQNFNYVLQGLDKAKLSYAESDVYPWQDFISYQAGARVKAGGKIHTCITTHNDAAGSNPQDPVADVTNSYWVTGTVYSNKANAYDNLLPKEGFKLDDVNSRTSTNLWESNDITLLNKNSVIAMNLEGTTYNNLLFGNVRGKLKVYNTGNVTDPDSTNLAVDGWNVYHEGNKPTQSDISGTIPDAPANGKAYTRKDNNWVVDEGVTTVNPMTVSGVTLTGGVVNQFRDSGSFTTPAASSVPVNTVMYLELSDNYRTKTPTVTAFAGDLFRNSLGIDTFMDFVGAAYVELVSNGVDEWAVSERAADGLDGEQGIPGTDLSSEVVALQTINDADVLCHLFAPNDTEKTIAGVLSSTRATTKTIFDRYGTLVTVPVDEIAINGKGALVGGSGTNLSNYSNAVSWSLTRVTRATDGTKDIDGVQDAQKITVNTDTATHSINLGGLSIASGNTYTKSVIAEAGNGTGAGRYLALETDGFVNWSNDGGVYFDLVNGTVFGGTGDVFNNGQYKITNMLNGRYLCEIQMDCVLTGTISQEIQMYDGSSPIFTGNGTDYIYIHDSIQVEDSPFATSRIKTTGLPATRAADDISLPVYNNLLSYEQGDHTQTLDVELTGDNGDLQVIYSSRASDGSQFRFVLWVNGDKIFYRDGSGSAQAFVFFSYGTLNKIAAVTKDGELTLYINGVAGDLVVNTPITTLKLAETLHIGSTDSLTNPISGYIKNFRIFDRALTADEVKLL